MIAAGGRNGSIQVWNAETGSPISEYHPHRQRIRSLEFTAGGLILSCGDDQTVRVSQPLDGRIVQSLPRHLAKLFAVKLINDELLATAGSDNLVHIWQMSDSRKLETLRGHTGTVSCLDLHGDKLASGSYDTQVRIWHVQRDRPSSDRQTELLDSNWSRKLK
jgi:WD40 repeat protein